MTAHPANAASVEHAAGSAAAEVEEHARAGVSEPFGREPSDVTFAPGASPAIWLAIQDTLLRTGSHPAKIVASAVEHPSLLAALEEAERSGRAQVELVGANGYGAARPDLMEAALAGGADLACFMAANNETGTVTDLEPVLAAASRAGARLLVDASQAAGKIDMDLIARADLIVVSGAKIYGPRRSGALVGRVSPATRIRAHDLFGSPDPASASALALALSLRLEERAEDEARVARMRDALESELLARVPGLRVNSDRRARLAGSLHVSTPYLPGEAAVSQLWGRVAVSTGSACRSGVPGPSHVLRAMPVPEWVREGAVRIGLGRFTTTKEVEAAVEPIADALLASQRSRMRA